MRQLSLNEYKETKHYMLFEYAVQVPCGKVFRVLKTTQGFTDKENGGYFVSPLHPLNNGDDETAVRGSQKSVIDYLENKEWLYYKKIRIGKIINSLLANAKA